MEIRDPAGIITPVAVAKLCGTHGLPAPANVSFRTSRGRSAIYWMVFPPTSGKKPAALWVELATGVRGSSLQLEAAALRALEMVDGVLHEAAFSVRPNYTLNRWTAVRPAIDSANGSQWIDQRPSDWPTLGRRLGQCIMALQDTRFPTFGSSAEDGRFLGVRSTWKEEWQSYVSGLAQRTTQNGVDMGPLTKRIVGAIEDRLDSLDSADEWCLVHGGLGPQSVEIVPHGVNEPSVLLTGWDDVMVGDPVAESASLLGLAPHQLSAIFRGLDLDLVESWLAPEVLRRVEVYHYTWILNQIATIGDFYAFDQVLGRLANLGRIRQHARDALAPDFCASRIRQTLAVAEPETWRGVPQSPVAGPLQIALGALASQPSIPPNQALLSAASIGACLLADTLDSPRLIKGCLTIAVGCQPLKKGRPHPPTSPVGDLATWTAGLSSEVEATLGQRMVDSSAIVTWWTGLAALQRVDEDVSQETLRGLERLVRGSLHLARLQLERSSVQLPQQLTYAALGLGAVYGLRGLSGDPGAFDTLAEIYRDVLREAALDIDLQKPVSMQSDWTREDVLSCLDEKLENGLAQVLRPLLVHSLCQLHGHEALPGGPRWVCEHAGV